MSTRPNPNHPRVEEDVIPGVSKSLQFTIKLLELQKPCSRTPRCISRHEFEVILRDWMLASRKINERIRNIVLQSGYTISAAGQLEEVYSYTHTDVCVLNAFLSSTKVATSVKGSQDL